MIKNILWDVDGTLLNFDKSEEYAFDAVFRAYQLELRQEIFETYQEINSELWKSLEQGLVTREQVLTGRFDTLFEKYHIKGINSAEFGKRYLKELGNVYYYNEDSLKLCQKLRQRYKQYIVTNGVYETQKHKLQLAGFWQLMDGIFISEKIGYEKPQKKFFEAVFESIGEIKPEETIIVGDSLSSDIAGGNASGIRTVWYNPFRKQNSSNVAIPDDIIFQLWDVEEIL